MTTSRLAAVAFALAVVVLAPAAYDHPNIYDEGIVVVGAMRLLDGDLPHLDFWTMYPPGVFLLFAAIFQLFGATLFVERTASLLLSALLVAGGFATAARRAGPLWAFWTAALVTLWLRAGRLHASAVVPALLCVLAVVWLLRVDAGRATTRAVAAGLVLALAAMFRHDLAAYAFVATAAGLLLSRCGRMLLVYTATATVAVAAVAAVLTALVGADRLLDQLIVFPVWGFPSVRALPYPSLALAVGPPVLAGAAIVAAAWQLRAGARAPAADLMMLGLTGGLFVLQSIVRSDFGHVLPSFVLAVTAVGMALGGVATSWRTTTRSALRDVTTRSALRGVVAVAVTVFAVACLPPPAEPPARHAYRLPAASGLYSSADPTPYEQAIALVQRLTPPGAPIFVGNDRHDRLFINDVLFYALAGRPPATGYHELHPGVATTAPVQRAIVADLERHDVQTVIVRTERHPLEHANASSRSSGVTLLDEHLASSFAPVGRFGDYEVRRRITPARGR
jgi:hypothetical protein